jgi:protein ImuB
MRDIEHLCRLLAENLAKVQLLAPAGDLELEALDVHALEERTASLLPETVKSGESLTLVLERIAARLGPECVLRPVLVEDHRLEWMQHWQPAPQALPRKRARAARFPQPTFVLPEPLPLAVRNNRPMYQGPLHLLTGPHRVEVVGGTASNAPASRRRRTSSGTTGWHSASTAACCGSTRSAWPTTTLRGSCKGRLHDDEQRGPS